MTAAISSNSLLPGLAEPQGSDRAAASASAPAPSAPLEGGGAAESEAVTLSAGAQATTQLLDAAQQADGVDNQAVQSLSDAINSGSYGVSPEHLAQAMLNAQKEMAL